MQILRSIVYLLHEKMESFFIGLVKVRLKGKRADLSALFLFCKNSIIISFAL